VGVERLCRLLDAMADAATGGKVIFMPPCFFL
jgi:hypothetical protein